VVDAIRMVDSVWREDNNREIRTSLLLRIFNPPSEGDEVETFRVNDEDAGPIGHDPS
jgi:t-SNARE complex subunit (syntaxin)